jgi:homoserine acetyltransferase
MVRADKRLLDHLGLTRLHAAIGGSMGGMRVLQFGIEYPDFIARMLPMATTARENAQAIASTPWAARRSCKTRSGTAATTPPAAARASVSRSPA